jgi:DNA-3-methyladenine glycosylase II
MTLVQKEIEGKALAAALRVLGRQDPDLARAYKEVGPPPPRSRPAGFASLLDIILAQQVSTHSYRAIAKRLEERIGATTPRSILDLEEGHFRTIGFSRQKVIYARGLAEAAHGGALDLDAIAGLSDDEALAALIALKGIGRWTAEIYLMFCLARPDIMPAGDLALREAAGLVKRKRKRPDEAALRRMSEAWRPWRSVASRLLWHYYAVKAQQAKEARMKKPKNGKRVIGKAGAGKRAKKSTGAKKATVAKKGKA